MTSLSGQDRPKLLLVDDEDPILALLETTLHDEDRYEILLAHDGAQALDIWRSERPDVMLLDVKMPKLDGVSLCQQVRDAAGDEQPTIIMLTAMTQPADIERAMSAGADAYLTKPFSPSDLYHRVERLLPAA